MHAGRLKDFQGGSRVPAEREASMRVPDPERDGSTGRPGRRAPFGLGLLVTVLIGSVVGAVSTLPVMVSQIAATLQGRSSLAAGFIGIALNSRAEIPTWTACVIQIGMLGGLLAAIPGALILEALNRWDDRPARRRVRSAAAGFGVGLFFGVLCWLACAPDEAGAPVRVATFWFPLTVVLGGAGAGYLSAAWLDLAWRVIRKHRERFISVSLR